MKPEELKVMSEGDGMACMTKAELREVLAGIERLESFKLAYMEWSDKTEWVQDSVEAGELGKHRADAIRIRFDRLKAENESLRKDAERYAHLKSAWQDDFLIAYLDSNVHPCGWDEAIDAHMNRSPENP